MSKKDGALLDNEIRNEIVSLQYEDGNTLNKNSILEILDKNKVNNINPSDINVYKSNEEQIGLDTGFDGAAIHIHNEATGLNEVYYIFRGTETSQKEDLIYNAMGIVGGTATDQIRDAGSFYDQVEANIAETTSSEINRYGDGHSLGGHLIISTALLEKSFDDVRGINDAPVNLSQLVNLDPELREYVISHTSISNVEDVSPTQLKKIVTNYYSDEAKVITHERMKGEPLYAQTIPNTAYLGHKINYYGDPNTAEFPDLYEAPKSYGIFQSIAPQTSPAFLLINRFMYDQTMNGLTNTMGSIGEKYTVAEANAFVASAYQYGMIMPRDQKLALGVTGGTGAGALLLSNPLFAVKAYDVTMAFGQMDLHSMDVFIDAYKESDKPILVQYVDPGSGKRIFVNADKLLQVRDTLNTALEEKKQALKKLKEYLEHEIYEQASLQKSRYRVEMSEKEANWRQFLTSEGKTYGEADLYKPTGISFRREFDEIDASVYDSISEMIELYQLEHDQLEKLYSSFEANLQTIFEVDEELAQKISS